ncbi:hypothetical protein QJQ45_019700 [Haematococcus lacustris]|nr:hypothetical protein QJQ45_019700 [Haematococcus lacustris]
MRLNTLAADTPLPTAPRRNRLFYSTGRTLTTCSAMSGSGARTSRKPEWVRIMEEDADEDEDVAKVLRGANGDPEKIRDNIRRALQNKDMFVDREGQEAPPNIRFREMNPFGLWVWLEFSKGAPSPREVELLEALLQAWFMVGKMGGYNSQNMQVFYNAGDDQSFFNYSVQEAEDSQGSLLHDVSQVEVEGEWARFRVDMGTCDELALDVLLNSLMGFSRDLAGLSQVLVGGVNEDWEVPEEPREDLDYDELKPNIDPMQLPEGLDEEFGLLDDLDATGVLTPRPPSENQELGAEFLGGRAPGAGAGQYSGATDQAANSGRGRQEGVAAGQGLVGSTRVARGTSGAARATSSSNASESGTAPESAPKRRWGDGLIKKYSESEMKRVLAAAASLDAAVPAAVRKPPPAAPKPATPSPVARPQASSVNGVASGSASSSAATPAKRAKKPKSG